jgi:superfamily II DNA or RNA helicase
MCIFVEILIMKKQIKLREYQTSPVDNVYSKLESGKKVILNGCPGSGKTEMSIYIIKKYLDSGKKVLVLAHSTNVLKKNFQDRWNTYYDNHDNLTICIPQSYKSGVKYDLAVIDESHENYLAKVVQDIVKDIPAQLLLTGTPSNLIYKGGFDIEVIAMEDVPREFFAKTGIELLSTCYKWTETDYNADGELKRSASITKSDTELSLDAIIVKLIDRLRNKSISAEKFNKPGILTRIQKSIFNSHNIGKTMFVCSRKTQADYVNDYLVKKGYNSKVSHATSDNDSVLFDSFKDGDFDVLVVVNRGRLGYSDDNLMNIIDMSGTKNPNLIYQMFARCVRGNQSQHKLFMKLAPTGNAMLDLTSVATQMALSLMFKDVISVFNGKNMKGMFIPIMKSSSDIKVDKPKSKVEKIKTEKSNRVIFPQYTTDVLVELKNIYYSMDSELSIYKKGDIGEIISEILDSRLPAGYWNEEKCFEESSKYSSSNEWISNSPGSASAARRLRIYEKCCENYIGSINHKNRMVRTESDLLKISKKYKNVTEWKADDIASYKYAHKKGVLSKCVEHMPKRGELKTKWTFEFCKNDIGSLAKEEWKKKNRLAYRRAEVNGWLKELFK